MVPAVDAGNQVGCQLALGCHHIELHVPSAIALECET
jgi:hypothetical protein